MLPTIPQIILATIQSILKKINVYLYSNRHAIIVNDGAQIGREFSSLAFDMSVMDPMEEGVSLGKYLYRR